MNILYQFSLLLVLVSLKLYISTQSTFDVCFNLKSRYNGVLHVLVYVINLFNTQRILIFSICIHKSESNLLFSIKITINKAAGAVYKWSYFIFISSSKLLLPFSCGMSTFNIITENICTPLRSLNSSFIRFPN